MKTFKALQLYKTKPSCCHVELACLAQVVVLTVKSLNSDDDSAPVGLEYFKVSDTTPGLKAENFTTLPLKVMVVKSKSNFFQVAEDRGRSSL